MDKKQKDYYLYQRNWQKENYERLCYQSRKELHIKERIRIAAELRQQTSAQYAISAILSALDRDGVTVESLPDRAESVKQD